ncbi:MAG: hypothetical protein DRQ40_05315 [Gammaproteobacteria bacterium]|nr:MAG: hypothetical protein DRQ40_05315 [Gammaproteobacteria bacterium]
MPPNEFGAQPVDPYRDPSPPTKPTKPRKPINWPLVFAVLWLGGLLFSFLGWALFVHTGMAIQTGAVMLVALITGAAVIKVLNQ